MFRPRRIVLELCICRTHCPLLLCPKMIDMVSEVNISTPASCLTLLLHSKRDQAQQSPVSSMLSGTLAQLSGNVASHVSKR